MARPGPRRIPISVKVAPADLTRIDVLAAAAGLTRSIWVRQVLDAALTAEQPATLQAATFPYLPAQQRPKHVRSVTFPPVTLTDGDSVSFTYVVPAMSDALNADLVAEPYIDAP